MLTRMISIDVWKPSMVMSKPIEHGDPEHLRARELGFRHLHTSLRGRHDEQAGVGEPQCGGEFDRKTKVSRLQGCCHEPQGAVDCRWHWHGRCQGRGWLTRRRLAGRR
jgi:hypothetical protein